MKSHKIKLTDLKDAVRNVPDFPKKGIQFKDLTTVFKSSVLFNFMVNKLYNHYKDLGITKVVCIESRGFIVGSALAHRLNAGVVLARKPNKLPAETYKINYSLEYGEGTLEIHKDALDSNDVVLIHDDLLATGGTALAVFNLIDKFGINRKYVNIICELESLKGREKFNSAINIFSLIKY